MTHENYDIKAHQTLYRQTMFRSRLEARWAAFFDLAGWEWVYEPIDLDGWSPDFYVKFLCGHSACNGYHDLLVEVKPYSTIDQFHGHPCRRYDYGRRFDSEHNEIEIHVSASAAFGISPRVTFWTMVHGAGGGDDWVGNWVRGDDGLSLQGAVDGLWAEAGNMVQWKPAKQRWNKRSIAIDAC